MSTAIQKSKQQRALVQWIQQIPQKKRSLEKEKGCVYTACTVIDKIHRVAQEPLTKAKCEVLVQSFTTSRVVMSSHLL
jgi:hypothetical protein